MVVSKILDKTFTALADPTRRAILIRLSNGPAAVVELAEPFDVSQQAISKHVAVLMRAGLLRQKKEGRINRCELVAEPLEDAAEWIERYRAYWEGSFNKLEKYLRETKKSNRNA